MTTTDHPAVHHFQRWLGAGLVGCSFARKLAREPERRFAYYVGLDDLDAGHLQETTALIDGAASDNRVAILLFPRARDGRDVALIIRSLARVARWTVNVGSWQNAAKHGTYLPVSMEWTTTQQLRTKAMGFAPLGTMPVTRRAPYVGIAVWGGGYANQHKRSAAGSVGFIDVDPGEMTPADHEARWTATIANTKLLSTDPFESPKQLRDVTFSLAPGDAKACVR